MEEQEWQPVRIAPYPGECEKEYPASDQFIDSRIKLAGVIVRVMPTELRDEGCLGMSFKIHPEDMKKMVGIDVGAPFLCEHQIQAD